MTHDLVWLRWIHAAVDRLCQAKASGNLRAEKAAEAALGEVIQAMWESEKDFPRVVGSCHPGVSGLPQHATR